MMKTDARFENIKNWLNTELSISDYRLEVAS
ncbi:hypothetical protein MNBD_GAMMA10-883, partial [hydrothermal vent metagenome]